MKTTYRRLLATVLLMVTVVCMRAQEMMIECSYNTNQDYKCLLTAKANGSECVVIGGGVTCHYDIEWKVVGKTAVFYASNPSQSGWVNVVYLIGEDGKHIIFVPSFPSGNNCFPMTFSSIPESSREQKRREYGIDSTSGQGAASTTSGQTKRNSNKN